MGYSLNPVKGDIMRLESLFWSLSNTFREQEIDDELQTKSVELEKLFKKLAEMVCNFYDVEAQHERSVLEVKKHERIVLELWLEELQEAVFNTEDLVDKIHTEALRHKLDGQVSEKMEDIRRCIESHVKEGDVLGMAVSPRRLLQKYHEVKEGNMHNDPKEKQRSRGPIEQPWKGQRQPLDPTDYNYFVDESEVFGMDCDKEEIIKLLLSDDANDKQLSVISIVGNGRIGKTTLARLVYNEQRVSHHFDRKAWVDVTYDFDSWVNVPDDFNWVTWSILEFLTSQYEDLREKYNILHQLELDQLRPELQNCLKGKRFLLVLDFAKQIPSFKGWEALQSAFNFAANGSHIIVTTRNEVIAPMKYAVRFHRMEPLSEEKCWTIFAKFAFGDQNPTSDRQLEVIGKEIVQMCHGLPSSARILGSLLRFKLQQEEWEAILKRLKPSSDSKENVDVVPYLREYQKQLLAYCSIFPPDYEFEMEKLLLLWTAEGFPYTYETMKGAIDIISKELEPFLQKSSRNESSFRIYGNNLADYVSTRYCFRLEDNHPSQIPLNTRYLSLVGGKYENSVIFEAIDRAKLLRTFLALDHESRHLCATELQNLLSKLQFLRVLSLSHYHITEIPDSIGNLEHLRYIDLSHTAITRLPESVCELYNLQSLILSNCHSLTELPENTSNLKNLFYLDVSGSSLTELPENTSNLENLLYLDVSGSCLSGMPKRMSKLKKLKSLSSFVVGKSGSPLRELRNIELEGTLHISKLQNVASEDDACRAGLWEKCLHELVLEWDEDAADPKNATEVLRELRPNETCLAKLTINFYNGTKIATWFEWWKFDHLFFLRLSNCKNCSTLPSLSKLPSIRVLIIECMDAVEEVGPDFSGETSPWKKIEFKSLERLTFEGMSKWTKWVPLDVLPCLQQLCIRRCPKLRGKLPKELPLVERVEISESQELVTALTKEASLNNLHYREKIVFISDDKVTSFKSEGATGSSSLMIEGKVTEKPKETEERGETKEETDVEKQTTSTTNWSKHEQKESTKDPSQFPSSKEKSSLPLPQHAPECSKLVTLGTEERKDNEQETHLKVEKAFETKESKLEQEEYTKENSSSLFSGEKSLLPPTQDDLESTLPQPQASPKSLSPMTHDVVECSFTLPQHATECSSLVTQGIEDRGDSEQETHLEAETTSETKESKLEQEEYTKEDLSSLFSKEKSLLPSTQDASESSLPQPQASPKSLLPMTHDVVESSLTLPQLPFWEEKSSLPLPKHATECSSLVTLGTEERGDSEQETHLKAEEAFETKESKFELEKYTKKIPSSFFSEERSLLSPTQDASESTLPLPQHAIECSSLVTQGTKEMGDSEQETHLKAEEAFKTKESKLELKKGTKKNLSNKKLNKTSRAKEMGNNVQETHLEAEKTSKTKESKLEQEEYIKEDPSSLFSEEKSLLPPTQDASESLLPQPQASPKSLLPMTHDVVESSSPLPQLPFWEEKSSLPLPQHAVECSLLVTPGTGERGDSGQETHLEAETASETNESKLEQEEYIKEDPSSLFLEEQFLLPLTQDASEFLLPQPQDAVKTSLPVSQTPNFKEKADDSTTTWSNPDGPQYLSFKSMKVSGILQLIELPEGLHSLRIEGCDALEEIPEGIMASLNQLQHLYIINCCSLNSLPEVHPPTALKKLYVQNCKRLEIFSRTKRTLPYASLEHLCIGSSDPLQSLPLDLFPMLRSLSIWDCANLQSLSMQGENQNDLTSLEALEIRDCPKLESFLKRGLSASNLMSIWLSNCKNLKELPDQLDTLINSLRSLFINNCPELVSLPKLPSSLSLLSITFCYKLELMMDWGLHGLQNLRRLEIEGGCKNLESFPKKGLLPRNLNSLCISGLLNLRCLICKELQLLSALKTLEISCCNKLQPFQEEDLPSSLSLLCIKECSLLKPKLLKKRKMFD